MSEISDDEVLRAWVIAMHGWFVTKNEKWETKRQEAIDELMKRKLGLKMLNLTFAGETNV